MSIQTQQIGGDDIMWRVHMTGTLSDWDDALIAEGFNPSDIELLECDHCSSNYNNHQYLVQDTQTDEFLLLWRDGNGMAIGAPKAARQGDFDWHF